MKFDDAKELIQGLNQKYWFHHQSPKTCLLGSDGTGHDFIHPMDKLQAACRNAYSMIQAIEDMQDEQELLRLDMRELGHVNSDRNKILCRQKMRRIDSLELQIQERVIALQVYYDHAKSLLPEIEKKYSSYDDALSEIWLARVAYNAFVKSHPLGADLKVALMDENSKAEVLTMIGFPSEIGGKGLPIPNADFVMKELNKYLDEKKELNKCPSPTGSLSQAATLDS